MRQQSISPSSAVAAGSVRRAPQWRPVAFVAFLIVLLLVFLRPLLSLVTYALHSSLHSHIVLIPFICGYLVYILRPQLPTAYYSSVGWALLPCVIGAALVIVALTRNSFAPPLIAASLIAFVVTGGFIFMGKEWMSAASFPFAFLLFMIPLPDVLAQWMENASKFASAECANFFLHLTGTPFLREGTVFQLPNIVLEVAQECSGIRSSWVLLIASTLAAYLFLNRPWHRGILILASIPLGFLRNGFRIAVISVLCVHFGPGMIHSPIHKQGGPLFFALSLIPLFLILWLLRRRERLRGQEVLETPKQSNRAT